MQLTDLQKLWVVLLREKNMLHTARHWHSKRKTEMPHPDRLRRVRRSMAARRAVTPSTLASVAPTSAASPSVAVAAMVPTAAHS
mgnify:CR=1 FL=1